MGGHDRSHDQNVSDFADLSRLHQNGQQRQVDPASVAGAFCAEGENTLVCACNGRFYGGGFNPSTTARPDDGVMDVFIVKKVSLLTLARLIGKYAAGKADDYPEYITHLRTDRVEISFNEENVVNIDGEAIFAKEVKMQLLPGAMNLVVPRGMRFFQEAAQPAAARV